MRQSSLAVVATALVVVTGCVSSSQARNVKPSAFLGDTALLLKKGGKHDHLLVYRNEDAKWTSYDKIILDPVTIWGAESSKLPPEALADLQKLVDHFHQALADKLSKDYRLTDVPAPGAMRMQIAIINGERANAPLKVAKTVAPFAGTADMLWSFATGKPAFAGDVSIEYMIRDSETGTLLVAGDDRRVGGTQLGNATVTRWGDVQNILIYWSDEAVYFLCRDRKGEHCVKPKAGLVKNPVW